MGEGQALAFNILEPSQRAPSVTTILQQGRSVRDLRLRPHCLRRDARARASAISTGKAFRIAHMGHVNAPMVLGALSAVEMALQALNVPHGSGGVAAAISHLSAGARAA
jgi:alanine-glyoxylate transaminase/serine-glyoxylate transaminase/serine-pyruvate transaminase